MGGSSEEWLETQNERYSDIDYEYYRYVKDFVPSDPMQRYYHAIELIDEMLIQSGELKLFPMFHRMMLVQHVAMVEAYLADRLILYATQMEEVRRNLVLGHAPLKAQKFSLEAFVGNADLVTERVTDHLKRILYHELELVSEIYQCALGVKIFVDEDAEAKMKAAMIDRHHCVHRNGQDNEGKLLKQIDEEYISRIRGYFVDMVNHIEDQCQSWNAKLPM
ncbi:hypothetical protein [Mesorhizobium sp. M0217]|uniref:hypothetical protein n=1 Tax=unclassified Mesorhizobium TaxID=325217 RepID=UPI00333A6A27